MEGGKLAGFGLAGGEPVLDRSTLNSIRDLGRADGPDVIEELCSMYLSDVAARVAAARRAAAAGEPHEVARLAHAVKGAAGSFGARRVSAVAARLEEVAGGAGSLGEVVRELEVELDRCRELVEEEVLASPPPASPRT